MTTAVQGPTAPRRRTRSRRALIAAAQEYLAEGRLDFTAQEVADRAEVAVQTLYNHFASKEELLAAAAVTGLEDFEAAMMAMTADMADAAEVFCARVRLYGRLPEIHPMLARAFTTLAAGAAGFPDGFSPRVKADVLAAIEAGRLSSDDVDLALTALAGAVNWLVAVRLANPAMGPDRADDLAALFLTVLGMSPEEAAEVANRPLPGHGGG